MGLPVWYNRCISTPYEIEFVKNAELGEGEISPVRCREKREVTMEKIFNHVRAL